MASISPLFIMSPFPVSSNSTSSFYPLSKHRKPSRHRHPHHHVYKVACNANHNNPTPNLSSDEEQIPHNVGHRRNVLIGLGGLCGAATLNNNPLAFAAPIAPPELAKCDLPDLPPGALPPVNCCPPPYTKIIDFKFPSSSQPLKIRPAAHLVNDDYLAKYKKALDLMKALPNTDPRSFYQQANVHCAYCDGAYD